MFVCMCIPRGGHTIKSGVSLQFPPCLRQDLLFFCFIRPSGHELPGNLCFPSLRGYAGITSVHFGFGDSNLESHTCMASVLTD